MNGAEYLMKNYGDRGSSEISIILHMIRKPNSITVLLFIQNNSQFENIAKTCLPPSMHRCSVQLRYCTFRFVQLHNILQIGDIALRVVFLLFLPCFWIFFRLVLTLETSEMSAIFSSSQPKQLKLVPRSSRLTVP